MDAGIGFGERFQQLRRGFQAAFWVANASELFERLAFYSQQAFLALFLVEKMKLSVVAAGQLMGWFGLVVYALPVLVGSLADRFGFRRALACAYLFAAVGYFLLGSVSAPWMAPLRNAVPLYWLIFAILMITAAGPALVKPCVVGTVAVSSTEDVRSIGYSIYYTLVNVGGALGPLVGSALVAAFGMETNFRFSALVVFAMMALVLLLFREPAGAAGRSVATVRQAIANTLLVLQNWRFILFLLIFAGYWITFFSFFVVMPTYIHRYVAPGMSDAAIGRLLSIDALMIIFFQVLVSYLTRRVSTLPAMVIGVLLATLSMLTLSVHRSVWTAVAAMMVFSLGEMTQAPRFYEYVSRLAPSGQQGVFMGYAFLPIALGYFAAGQMGGHLLHHFGEVLGRPYQLWWPLAGIGAITALLMAGYNRAFVARAARPPAH
ncbi:MAG TPA: MFS transporter [Candidatus Acidoferrales bacterium]|nr:MFS transporter [Candidatus Acidoferrales bacterium]